MPLGVLSPESITMNKKKLSTFWSWFYFMRSFIYELGSEWLKDPSNKLCQWFYNHQWGQT